MKKKYDTLLFDVDDTLLDFGAAETQALGKLFNDLGIELDAEIEASYKSYNQSLWKKLEVGSITRKQLLATRFPSLKNSEHKLYVVSNGNLDVQNRRLRDSGFGDYFEQIFISEKMGVKKPDKEFFDVVERSIEGFVPERAVVIGDSLTSDIKGANNAGLDSVWFNPNGSRNETENKPTYEVKNLNEINKLV